MAKWRLAKSLEKLRNQINAAWPDRSKASDGTIGDAAHASRDSDHNPWLKVGGLGVVTACDITHDSQHGVDGKALAVSFADDLRSKYVIFNSSIWKARTGHWEAYHGPNKHTHHVHLSVKPDTCDDVTEWILPISPAPAPTPAPVYPTLRLNDRSSVVSELQTKLRAKGYSVQVDGVFGLVTESRVKQFQKERGLTVDGIVGKRTWDALR